MAEKPSAERLESETNRTVIKLSVLVRDGGTDRPQNLNTERHTTFSFEITYDNNLVIVFKNDAGLQF